MPKYNNFDIPIMEPDNPYGWDAAVQSGQGFANSLSNVIAYKREQDDAIKKLMLQKKLEEESAINTAVGTQKAKLQLAKEMMPMMQQFNSPQGMSMNPIKGGGAQSGAIGQENPYIGMLNPLSGEFEFKDNPRYKALQKEMDPLSGESANKYSGALQGLSQVDIIMKELGLNDISTMDEKKARDLVYRANLAVQGANAKDTILPMGKAMYQGLKNIRAGSEGSQLATAFMTLAENLLRARTGAAAPDPEIIREYARSLFRQFSEDPQTWLRKLQTNQQFLQGVAGSIKPNLWQDELKNMGGLIQDQPKNDVRSKYNQLREQGYSKEQAKQMLGL